MRGTKAKRLRAAAPDKRAYRKAKRAEQGWRRAGFSAEVTVGLPAGGVPAARVGGKYHPLRSVGRIFDELSDKGIGIAINLKFGPPRTHGDPKSLRAWPRGRPGTGAASRMPRPALLARIAELEQYRNVRGYQRV